MPREKVYPPDIARMALWLAADDSRMVTAQNFVVDGAHVKPSWSPVASIFLARPSGDAAP